MARQLASEVQACSVSTPDLIRGNVMCNKQSGLSLYANKNTRMYTDRCVCVYMMSIGGT